MIWAIISLREINIDPGRDWKIRKTTKNLVFSGSMFDLPEGISFNLPWKFYPGWLVIKWDSGRPI